MGSYCLHILGLFSIMRYRSLRRFPVPLVTTGMLILEAGPPTFYYPFLLNCHVISRFKSSVEKTVPKREPMGTQMDAKGCSKSTTNMRKWALEGELFKHAENEWNRRPETFKNHCLALTCMQISLCPPISKRLTKCHQDTFHNGAIIDNISFFTHLGNC